MSPHCPVSFLTLHFRDGKLVTSNVSGLTISSCCTVCSSLYRLLIDHVSPGYTSAVGMCLVNMIGKHHLIVVTHYELALCVEQ